MMGWHRNRSTTDCAQHGTAGGGSGAQALQPSAACEMLRARLLSPASCWHGVGQSCAPPAAAHAQTAPRRAYCLAHTQACSPHAATAARRSGGPSPSPTSEAGEGVACAAVHACGEHPLDPSTPRTAPWPWLTFPRTKPVGAGHALRPLDAPTTSTARYISSTDERYIYHV